MSARAWGRRREARRQRQMAKTLAWLDRQFAGYVSSAAVLFEMNATLVEAARQFELSLIPAQAALGRLLVGASARSLAVDWTRDYDKSLRVRWQDPAGRSMSDMYAQMGLYVYAPDSVVKGVELA